MNNSTSFDDFSLDQHEIDDLWRNINRAPQDPFSHWISIASFTLAFLGSISNLMCVIVLIRLSTQLSTFIYLTGLSLSDMITCLAIIFTHLVEFLVQTPRTTSITIFLRRIEIVFGALAAGSRVLSLWISTAVTMDRWILICYPIYGKTFCTLNRARIVSRTLFIIAFLYSVPLVFEYEIIQMPNVYEMMKSENDSSTLINRKSNQNSMLVTKGYSDLAKRRLYRWAYMFFNAIFVYTLPSLMIVFFNLQLIRALHRLKTRTKRLREKHRKNRRRSQQSKYSVTYMVIAMVLTLLLCRSPTIVLWVLWSFELTIKIFFDSSSSSLVRRFHHVANLIAILNAATNFLPFCVFGQLFRAECLAIYCCRKTSNEHFTQPIRRINDENPPQTLMKKIPPTIQIALETTPLEENFPFVTSIHSETTSGITSTQTRPTNVLSQFSSATTPLLKETVGL